MPTLSEATAGAEMQGKAGAEPLTERPVAA